MKNMLIAMLVTCLTGTTVLAGVPTQLNLRVERVSDESSSFTVARGESVNYQVIGSLSDTNNEGVALFIFDASYSCGDLSQMSLPDAECMENFEIGEFGLGITNPQGFGGTTEVPDREGDLVQVGGATNTILNDASNAPFPTGAVCLTLGHTELVLATGSLTIPADATDGQMCELALSDVVVNVVRAGEMDDGTFWAVDAGEQGTIQNMSMTVEECPVVAAFVSSTPDCDSTLPRTANNIIQLQFGSPITAPAPGEIEIRELLPGGELGAVDLSGSFTPTVEGGNVLKLEENGSILSNQTWYAIVNTGDWGCVAPFKRDYAVVYGDVDGNGETDVIDAAGVLGERADPAPDGSRFDVDGNGAVDVIDAATGVLGNRGSAAPDPRPDGHGSLPAC